MTLWFGSPPQNKSLMSADDSSIRLMIRQSDWWVITTHQLDWWLINQIWWIISYEWWIIRVIRSHCETWWVINTHQWNTRLGKSNSSNQSNSFWNGLLKIRFSRHFSVYTQMPNDRHKWLDLMVFAFLKVRDSVRLPGVPGTPGNRTEKTLSRARIAHVIFFGRIFYTQQTDTMVWKI